MSQFDQRWTCAAPRKSVHTFTQMELFVVDGFFRFNNRINCHVLIRISVNNKSKLDSWTHPKQQNGQFGNVVSKHFGFAMALPVCGKQETYKFASLKTKKNDSNDLFFLLYQFVDLSTRLNFSLTNCTDQMEHRTSGRWLWQGLPQLLVQVGQVQQLDLFWCFFVSRYWHHSVYKCLQSFVVRQIYKKYNIFGPWVASDWTKIRMSKCKGWL